MLFLLKINMTEVSRDQETESNKVYHNFVIKRYISQNRPAYVTEMKRVSWLFNKMKFDFLVYQFWSSYPSVYFPAKSDPENRVPSTVWFSGFIVLDFQMTSRGNRMCRTFEGPVLEVASITSIHVPLNSMANKSGVAHG